MKHVQVIVTEVGAEVQVERVIVGMSAESVNRRTRDCMRQLIESDVTEDLWPEDIESVLDHGYWHTDQAREDYSVLVLKPEQFEQVDPHVIEVHFERGMVTHVQMPTPIQARVIDYDTPGSNDSRVVTDAAGRPCVITTWGEAVADE